MRQLALAVLAALTATAVQADGVLNLYSSRHYDTDERLYADFEEMTGITINRIEGKADELIARMQAEGANSPADILLTVDTSRLERAKEAGILPPDAELQRMSRYCEVFKRNAMAGFSYHPKPYPDRVTLFRAAEQGPEVIDDPYNGWADFVAGGIEVCKVPGNHNSMFHPPQVEVLAQRLGELLLVP